MKTVLFNIFIFTLVLMNASKVLAAGGAVPAETVISQVANLTLLILLLYFTQRKTIAQAFADKKADFLKHVEEASASKTKAEETLKEVTARVNELKTTYTQQVDEAKKNAEESYRTQLADAKNEAVRLQNMTSNTLEFEVQKQIENLRVETFKKSADMAEKNLEKNLTTDQQKVWKENFVSSKGAH